MEHFDATVFGAGIAGTAIAAALTEKGKQVLVIDPHVSENAPGAPAALVNPATGRHARMSWESEQCMNYLRKRVDILKESSGRDDLVSDTGVVRAATTEKLSDSFRNSLENYPWPNDWIRWIEADEIKELNPEIAHTYGGLFLDIGFTVFVDNYLNEYRRFLRKSGADCRYEAAEYQYKASDNRFTIEFENGDLATSDCVIVAAGHQTPFFDDWEYLKLHRVKGQIIEFEVDHDLNWEHAVSSLGYILRRGKRDLVAGSTYEHHFDDLSITEDAYNRIFNKLENTLPEISNRVKKKNQLAGVRVTTPNKLPVIGRHRDIQNLCIYSAMGSKGLLFSEYVASLLAAHLLDGVPIPEELDTARLDGS